MSDRRTPGQRAGLSHAEVLAAARSLLAEQGLDGLTMRALARRLEVAPNSLYSHVPHKTALVDELIDARLADVDIPSPGGDPRAGLHRLMASTYRILRTHPDLVPLYLARQGARGPNARHLGEVVLGLLAQAGVTGARGREALRVLIVYTIGFAAFGSRSPVVPGPAGIEDELPGIFDSGLRWLLTGVIGTVGPTRDGWRDSPEEGA